MTSVLLNTAHRFQRKVRCLFRSNPPQPRHVAWDNARFDRMAAIVPLFYGFLLYLVAQHLRYWSDWRGTDPAAMDPLWPIAGLMATGVPVGMLVDVIFFGVPAVVLAATLWPQCRTWRALAFFGFFLFLAFRYSFGRIGHSHHTWLFIAFLWIFLPTGQAQLTSFVSRQTKQRVLRLLEGAQAYLLLTYTLAGTGKLLVGIYQAFTDRVSLFHTEAGTAHILDRLGQTGSPGQFVEWFVHHPMAAWAGLWVVVMIQLAAFIVFFRPRLHRTWAVLLIGTHLSTSVMMDIHFSNSVFLLVLLFLTMPSPNR